VLLKDAERGELTAVSLWDSGAQADASGSTFRRTRFQVYGSISGAG
jgi:hypothetical protein